MAENILQQHMKGDTQASIESKLNPKELAFNETLLQGVYKHLNGVTIETIPFASKLAIVTPGNSGGAGIGIDSSSNSILSSTNSQDLWVEVDAFIFALNNAVIKADGSISFTADQPMGNNKITGLATPTDAADAVTKAYADALVPTGVILADGTVPFTANQSLGAFGLTNVRSITAGLDGGSGENEFTVTSAGGSSLIELLSEGTVSIKGEDITMRNIADEVMLSMLGTGKNLELVEAAGTNLVVQNPIIYNSFEQGIVASPTQTQGNGPLTKMVNVIATVATVNDVVTTPEISTINNNPSNRQGAWMRIKNNGVNDLQVFPSSGDRFDTVAINGSITIAAGESLDFHSYNFNTWFTF